MPKLSVAEAAERLGVSTVRVRQRLDEGSLVGEKVGGRWLVDLSVIPQTKPRGRPVKPDLIWDTIRHVDVAEALRRTQGRSPEEALRLAYSETQAPRIHESSKPDVVLDDGSTVEVAPSSRRRALLRLLQVVGASSEEQSTHVEALLRWLGGRAERRLYRVAAPDLEPLRSDARVVLSGVSDPRSGMEDARVVEGYVASNDLDAVIDEHWLEPPGVDSGPNVFLHIGPARPSKITSLMLAADLTEHEGARERARAMQLAQESLT